MKILITKEVKETINKLGNKTARANGLKIYAALYTRSKRQNKYGYFDVPSTYLKSINVRYFKVIDALIENNIIDFYKREFQDPKDLFNTIERKYYNKAFGKCMKYKFLIDLTNAEEIEVELTNPRKYRWFQITKDSLESLGFLDTKISRDDFGRRVHHNLTQTYKEELKDLGLSVIDAKCSQPRLLYLLMKKKGMIDVKFFSIFENGIDFYSYLIENLDLNDRRDAKDLFMCWLNANGYVQNYNIKDLFPIASTFLKTLKSSNYKDSASFFQRQEAKIWIDDLLENIPSEFALSIHDSLIIKNKEANKILKYCKEKYPELEFSLTEL